MFLFPIRSELKKGDMRVFAKQLIGTMLARGLLEEKVVPNAVSVCFRLPVVQRRLCLTISCSSFSISRLYMYCLLLVLDVL
jgi:hypothetical protein